LIVKAIKPLKDSLEKLDRRERSKAILYIRRLRDWVKDSETAADIFKIPYSDYHFSVVEHPKISAMYPGITIYEALFDKYLLYFVVWENLCVFITICSLTDKNLFSSETMLAVLEQALSRFELEKNGGR